jgi:hypothetical protein
MDRIGSDSRAGATMRRLARGKRRATLLLLGAASAGLIAAAPASASPNFALSQSFSANEIAPSPATTYPVGGPAMQQARALADKHWGFDPCGTSVAVSWDSLDPSINATSTWWNPSDPYNNPQENNHCQVQFNVNQTFDWPMFCTVFVHEFGHLTGHQHNPSDSADVMYPVYTQPTPECASTPDPNGTQTSAAQTAAPAPEPQQQPQPQPVKSHRRHAKRHRSLRSARHTLRSARHHHLAPRAHRAGHARHATM